MSGTAPELNQKIRPDGCTVYFVARRAGEAYLADFFSQDDTFIETYVAPSGFESDADFIAACKTYARAFYLSSDTAR